MGFVIPDEYQEVEYLESTGTQYIKTNVLPSQDLSFHCKFLVTSNVIPGYGNVFGSRGNSGVREYQLTAYNSGAVSVGTRNSSLGFSPNEINIVDFDGNNTVNINGVSKIINTSTDQNDRPIILFGIINHTWVTQLQAGKIYELSFGNVANFIPCYRKSDSKPGMYDLVSDTFYTNSGTGEFLVGGDVYHDTPSLIDTRRKIFLNTPRIEPASGNVCTFSTDIKAPLKECKIHFSPVQEGSGDPSPDNVRPITGWDGVSVTRCGKNLFDASVSTLKTYLDASGKFHTGANWTVSGYIPVKPGTTYTFNPNSTDGATAKHGFYNADKTWVSYIDSGQRTFTVPDGVYYVAFSYRSASENVQLEIGSQSTTYEPYTASTFPISWAQQGTVYGGYVDLVSGEVWGTHVVHTGGWVEYSFGNGYKRYELKNIPLGNTADLENVSNITNSYGNISYSTRSNIIQPVSQGSQYVRAYMSLDENYSADIVQYGYKLATPTLVTTLTEQQIKTLKGINNIWSDANDIIEVKYWKH